MIFDQFINHIPDLQISLKKYFFFALNVMDSRKNFNLNTACMITVLN